MDNPTSPPPETKPPLGIVPEWGWRELRVHQLESAVMRFVEAGRSILDDDTLQNAVIELDKHILWLQKHHKSSFHRQACEKWTKKAT